MHIISIGYAKNVFETGSREQLRMLRYARALESLTMIVFTRTKDGLSEPYSNGTLAVIPTHSWTRIGALIRAYREIARILKQHPDRSYIVTAQDPFETSIIALLCSRYLNAQHHIQVHGDFFGSPFWRKESLLNTLRYRIGMYMVQRAQCIRVVSERIARSLRALGVPRGRIVVLPIRTELSTFLDTKPVPQVANEHSDVTVVTVSRLAPEKHITVIIDALFRARKRLPQLQLRIVGSGPELKRLRAHVQKRDMALCTTFVPWTDDVVSELQRADIFALSSKYEGYALVLVEAMATGLPVVTTNVGCAGEVVHDGVQGHVVPVGDIAAFAGALEKLAADQHLRERMGQAGRRTATELAEVSEDTYVQRWVSSFKCQ